MQPGRRAATPDRKPPRSSRNCWNGSWDSGVALAEAGLGFERDKASSSFDVRHAVSAGVSYALPGDWALHAVLRARSGFPIDVLAAGNLLGLGFDNAPRPDLAGGAHVCGFRTATRSAGAG